MKDSLEYLNDVEIDLTEYDEQPLNDIEKQKMKRNFRESLGKKKTSNSKKLALKASTIIALLAVGVVSFGVKGGRAAGGEFMAKLGVAAIETHVADARTCCLHPASSTHRQMNDEELVAAGVGPDLVRLSCGLEDAEDLIADIAQALE